MTHDLEARLRAAYAPLAPDPARADDLAAALLDAPQAPAPGRLGRMLPWGVAIAATLVGAFLLARGPGPADRAPRPAHDGPAVTAFVDARGRATLAGVDGRALRTWELGDLPIDLAIPAEIGAVLVPEVAPYAPPVDSNALPRTPDAPTLGPAFRGPSPVALVIDAAPDAPWRHVETMLLGAATARLVDVEFLDPRRDGPPVLNRLPFDSGPDGIQDHNELDPEARLELRLRAVATAETPIVEWSSRGATVTWPLDDRGVASIRDGVRTLLDAHGAAEITLEVFPLPPDRAASVSYHRVFSVLRAIADEGKARVLFVSGARGRSK